MLASSTAHTAAINTLAITALLSTILPRLGLGGFRFRVFVGWDLGSDQRAYLRGRSTTTNGSRRFETRRPSQKKKNSANFRIRKSASSRKLVHSSCSTKSFTAH